MSTYEYLKKGGNKVLVDAAIRDRNGKIIDTFYTKKSDHDAFYGEYESFSTDINNFRDSLLECLPSDTSSTNYIVNANILKNAIQTMSATYRGSFVSWSGVPTAAGEYLPDAYGSTTPDENDTIIIENADDYTPATGEPTTKGTWMFKYTGLWDTVGRSGWHPYFQIASSPLTPAQLAALNSGITAAKVGQYDADHTKFANYTPTKFAPSTRTAATHTQEVYIDTATGKLYVKPTTKSDVGLGSVTDGVHAGGTAVTLNGTSKADSSASFYAPTSGGTSGQFLKSNGSSAPTWGTIGASDLPKATQTTLGAVKATTKPSNANTLYVYVDSDGMLTAEKDPLLIAASDLSVGQILGVRSVGGNKTIAWYTPHADGSNWGFVNPSARTAATHTQEVYMDTTTGKLYTNPGEIYTLPPASSTTLGGVKVAGASSSGVAYFNTYMTAGNILVVERGIAGSTQLGCVKASTIASTTNHAAIQIDSSGNMYDDFTSTTRTITDETEPTAA